MLIEILIYLALFSATFTGAFLSAFQTIETLHWFTAEKNNIDNFQFFSLNLNNFVKNTFDWSLIDREVISNIARDSGIVIDNIEKKIVENGTSTNKILFVDVYIKNKIYKFSYVQGKN